MQIGIKNRGGRKTKRKLIIGAALTAAIILAAGCINYDQKMTLNADGSGTVIVHYTSDDPKGTYGGPILPFTKEEIEAAYGGLNLDVRRIMPDADADEFHPGVKYRIDFADIADLNGRGVFAAKNLNATKDVMTQVFTLDKAGGTTTFTQTCVLNVDVEDASELKYYEFTYFVTCPEAVTMTNGTVESDGCTVNWSYTLPGLINNPVKMYAVYGEPEGTGQGCVGPGKVSD
jgi:hypothetical protein